jgi:ligand-binding sensor domain-containing protein
MRFFAVSIFLSFLQNFGFSQSTQLAFDRFQQVRGLGSRSIHSMVQDNNGYIWLGSQDGLLRFDGYDLKIIKNNLRDKNSLTDNNIRALAKDKEGNIWIATQGGGLDMFDLKTESFAHFRNDLRNANSISGNAVWSVFVDKDNKVWAGTWSDGLNVYDQDKKKFNRISSIKDPVMAIAQSADGRIWFGSGGLNVLDPKGGGTKKYTLQSEDSDKINSGVRAITIAQSGDVWVATEEDGIYVLDVATESISRIANTHGQALNQVYTLFENKDRKMFAGTNGGLIIIANNQIESIQSHNPANVSTISNNSIRSISSDAQGSVWLGCEGGGLNKILERKNFVTFRHQPDDPNSISFNLIRSIYDDSHGKIWVGTQGGGLNIYDPAEEKFSLAGNGGKDGFLLSSNQVSSIFEDGDVMWIGTWGGGLNKVNRQTNEVKVYRHEEGNDNSIPDDRVQVTYLDKRGDFWVGTESGLALFDRENETWRQFRHDARDKTTIIGNNIQGQAFVETNDGSLWIGTWFGLNQYDPEKKAFKHFTSDTANVNSLSNDHVISLHADKSGNLWIGTFGGGLNQLEIQSGKISHFTETEGLPNNTIYGIREDNEGNLWLSTSNGLSRFNPKTKAFRNYDATEGLQSNEFYWGAAHKAKDGSLLFGGINGLNWFKPTDIKDNAQVPPVLISDFQIFNKSVAVGKNSLLRQSINFTENIKLKYDQAVLSFQFVALNYNYPEKNQYAYKLENFDEDWNYSGNKRTSTYTNLDPGEYVFRVKASNNDNVWNENGVSLRITITPPFWKTWWFYSIVAVSAFGLIYGFVKFRVRELKRDKENLRISLEASLKQAQDDLERQKRNVKEEQNRNKERNWIDQSLSKFGEILSQSKNDVKVLCSTILNALVRHLEVAGGAIYVFDKKDEVLKPEASYGFENLSPVEKGNGMVGVCFEQAERNILNNIPTDYYKISSGLGQSTPKAIVLIPIKYEEICLGVIELAAFGPLSNFQVKFVELLADRLTTTINTTMLAQNTEQLLQETQHQAEELKVREEELRQNLEELQAINEDRDRRTKELESQLEALKTERIPQ